MKNGYTFFMIRNGKQQDIFVETDAKRKTKKLAQKVARALLLPDNPGTIHELIYFMQRATCEEKTLPDGRRYYEISGDGFGGRGSFVDDDKTVIITL